MKYNILKKILKNKILNRESFFEIGDYKYLLEDIENIKDLNLYIKELVNIIKNKHSDLNIKVKFENRKI